jgi:hypothetical protein
VSAEGSRPLEQAKLRHRRRVAAGHDDVVEHLHIDELQGALQLARENLVGAAGLSLGRRVLGCIRYCQQYCHLCAGSIR